MAIAWLIGYRETLAAGRQPEVHGGRRGESDDLSGPVDQRAAGVARAHRGRELDQAGQLIGASRERVFGVDGSAEGGHGTYLTSQRAAAAPRIAEGDDRIAFDELSGVADRCGR